MNQGRIATAGKAVRCKPSRLPRLGGLILATGLFWLLTPQASAQEALRQSLAGAAAAQAQSQAAQTVGYYNLKLGDLTLRFASGAGAEFNDNVRLSQTHREGDLILTPSLNTQLHYPLTQNNSLDISISAGYRKYLDHPDLDQFFITPGSGLLYNIYVGDFVINLHDRVSITENGYQNAAANGQGNNSTLNNTAGVGVNWDLNKAILTAGYDHVNYVTQGSGINIPDSASENVFLNAGAWVLPELLTGVEAGGSYITYAQSDQTSYPNAKQWSAGVFGNLQISELMHVSLHGGFTDFLPNGGATNLVVGSQSGMYFAVALSHRVNEFLSYTLTASRSQTLQSFGQPYTMYNVRLAPNWNVLHHFSLSTPFWWTQGTQLYSQANPYDQYGAGVNLGRQLTEHLSGSLAYQYVQETSSESSLNYIVNTITLNFSYRF